MVLATQSAVFGRVVDSETGQPLVGAAVALSDLGRSVATDSSGRYVLVAVPAGPQHIQVRALGYMPRSLHALVPRDGQLEINVALEPQPIRFPVVEVHGPILIRGLERGDSTSFPDRETSIAAAHHHPLLAETDAFQALAGGEAAQNPETPRGFQVRGGAADQTAYLLDGIPVLSPYHAAGMSSAWNPDALSRLRLTSSAPDYPSTLSGAIEGVTREPGDRLAVQSSLSTTQTRITADGPIAAARAGYVVSIRSGIHDAIAPRDASSYLRNEAGDWLAKLEADAAGGRLRVLGCASANEIRAAARAGASADTTHRNLFEWTNQSLGVEWRRADHDATTRLMAWNARGDANSRWTGRSGPVAMDGARNDFGLLLARELRGPRSITAAELRLERMRTGYAITSDSAAGPSWNIGTTTPIATATARYGVAIRPRLELEAGATFATIRGTSVFSPSARCRYDVSERWTATASYGWSHQFAQSLRNAESVIGNVFPVEVWVGPGAPGVPVARGDLGLVAAEYRPWSGVRLGVQAYARESSGLVLVAPREGGPFATGGFVVGSGSARGASVDFALSSARLAVLASYGAQRVRLHYADSSYVPDGAAHRIEGGVIVFPSPTASVRVGITAELGRRTTTIPGGFEWESCNLLDRGCELAGSPDYTGQALGATRLPAYLRVDLGMRKHWHLSLAGRDETIALFGSVTNILRHRNILTYARDPATGAPVGIEMRPAAPLVVGVDINY